MDKISSVSNDKIKYIQRLRKSAGFRKETKTFVVEGIRMFREIPEQILQEIYYTEEAADKYLRDNIQFRRCEMQGKAFPVTDKVFKSISDTGTPQGILALVKMPEHNPNLSEKNDRVPLLLILETLQDPGNMGTIIRTAEGAGVTGILVSSDSVDIYNPKVVRATMGSIFRMNICVSTDLTGDICVLKKRGITVYGAHLNGEAFYEKDLTKPAAFLIGNEGNGLSDETSSLSDELIRIPMMGKVESLNAAVSAAVISYEALRQRNKLFST